MYFLTQFQHFGPFQETRLHELLRDLISRAARISLSPTDAQCSQLSGECTNFDPIKKEYTGLGLRRLPAMAKKVEQLNTSDFFFKMKNAESLVFATYHFLLYEEIAFFSSAKIVKRGDVLSNPISLLRTISGTCKNLLNIDFGKYFDDRL